jgi:hypothetical protein
LSAFEFFFSFYGLLLGLCVAELVGGFARLLHDRSAIRFGVLTPLLAGFVASDIATFWNQAWVIFRFAPFNLALLTLGMVVASTFYIAATLTFPRVSRPGDHLDAHFWANRRIVLLCVLAANWLVGGSFLVVASARGELAELNLGARFWIGLAFFSLATLTAALANGRRTVMAALALLAAYQIYSVGRAALALAASGGWSFIAPQAE